MKLPKFRKNSTHLARQESLARSNRQLLLTDSRYRLQPQKLTTTIEEVSCKDVTPVHVNKQAPKLPATQPPQLATQTPILFQMRKSQANKSVDLNSSRIVGSGRFAKSAQPKRLQRNRALVSSKPNYTLRPTTTRGTTTHGMVTPITSRQRLSPVYQEITSPSTPSITRNLFKKNIAFDETANEFDFVDAGCLNKVTTAAAPPLTVNPIINIDSVDTPANQQRQQKQQQPAETYLVPSSTASQRTLASTTPATRFSLSKLTKFVSKSALKFINPSNSGRKSIGSNGSTSPESISPDTSVNTSPSNSMITDDDTRTSENFYFTVQPTPQPSAPVTIQSQQQQVPCFNESIYKSFEQYKQMEAKITQTSLNRVRSNSSQFKEQPIMGITSVLLKQYKKANSTSNSSSNSSSNSYNSSLSSYLGSATFFNPYLIAAPIVINTSTESVQSSSSCDSNYDKLAQRRVNSQTIDKKTTTTSSTSSKNIVRPVLKSLSSLINTTTVPPKSQIAVKSPMMASSSSKPPVYYKIEQELHYESFNESIF